MQITNVKNKAEWEAVLERCREKSFLSSWEWGDFWVGQGKKIKRAGGWG